MSLFRLTLSLSVSMALQRPVGNRNNCYCEASVAIIVPKLYSLFVNILLKEGVRKVSQKYQTSGSIQRYEDCYFWDFVEGK